MNLTWKIIAAVIIVAVIVGGGFYFWQQNKKVETPQVTQKKEAQATETEKIFEGKGFSFNYPTKYVADNKGLWTEEGYEWHLNPPETCDLCHLPYIEVKAEATNQTLEQYIITDFALLGKTLKEMTQQTGIPYKQIKIGNNDFIKITVSEMLTTTGYYTKHNNTVVAFRIFSDKWDDNELQVIIKSLKFE